MAAAEGMAKAAFPDCPAPLDGPLLALEQSTTAARRSQVGARSRKPACLLLFAAWLAPRRGNRW